MDAQASEAVVAPAADPGAAQRAEGGPYRLGLTVTGDLRRYMLACRRSGMSLDRVLNVLDWAKDQAEGIWNTPIGRLPKS